MLAVLEITAWHWVGFVAFVLVALAIDLGLFHRHAHRVSFKEAIAWTTVWVSLALTFAIALRPLRGEKEALEFVTGYLLELSLSLDNVFVIALIFAYFRIPNEHQHRVLFWGILGALIMRGIIIAVGVALIHLVTWVLYLFGIFLLYTGIKMLFVETEVEPEKNPVLRLARKFYPVSPNLDGQKFFTEWQGRRALTPLALVLLLVETTDLIFAVDSIPAIFAVTTKPFIVFTSNVFAILGLRSMYFLLAGAMNYFRYLKTGLSFVLIFIGIKMLLDPHDESPEWYQLEIPISISLSLIAGILAVSVVISLIAARRTRAGDQPADPPAK